MVTFIILRDCNLSFNGFSQQLTFAVVNFIVVDYQMFCLWLSSIWRRILAMKKHCGYWIRSILNPKEKNRNGRYCKEGLSGAKMHKTLTHYVDMGYLRTSYWYY